MSSEVRPFRDADTPLLIALWKACGLLRPWNDPQSDIAQAIRSGCAAIFVLERDKTLVASIVAGDDGHRGWLYYVSVHPDHRRRGLGRQVVAAAEDWLRARGVAKVDLMIRPENRQAEAFYAAVGYDVQPRTVMARWLDGRPITP